MRSLAWLSGLVTACGRLSFDPVVASRDDAAGGDGVGGGDSVGDLGDALQTCPSPIVTDGFDDGVLDATWTNSIDPRIALSESNSHLVFTYGAPANTGTTSSTSPAFDLRMRCVTLTIASIRGASNSINGIEVGTSAARIRIQVVGNQLSAIDVPFTTIPPTFTFDPVAHARWRVQLGGGHVVAVALDSSGTPTTLLRDFPSFFDESASQIMLYAGVNSGNVSGGTTELDAIEY